MKQVFHGWTQPGWRNAVFTITYPGPHGFCSHIGSMFEETAREMAIANKLPGFWRVKVAK